MTRIVSYVHRPKRLPRKQATAAAIVTATNKRDTITMLRLAFLALPFQMRQRSQPTAQFSRFPH